MNSSLHEDSEENWSSNNKNIMYVQLTQHYASGGPEMHAI